MSQDRKMEKRTLCECKYEKRFEKLNVTRYSGVTGVWNTNSYDIKTEHDHHRLTSVKPTSHNKHETLQSTEKTLYRKMIKFMP